MMWQHSDAKFTGFLFSFLFLLHWTSPTSAQWVLEPSADQYEQTRGLIHETFESASMKTMVGYCVVTPPTYQDSQRRYPVVYWLHGGGGNESSSLWTARIWGKLYKDFEFGEVILVYPNGLRSGYMDHQDGKVMVESMFIKELIPRIDQRYRTIASSHGRALHGFSMGASGALKFAIKYPGFFCAAVAYGGGAIDLENTQDPFVLKILDKNLGMDPDLIQQNNTYRFLEKNHEIVRRNDIKFLLICGDEDSWMKSAIDFHGALEAKNLSSKMHVVRGVGHDIRSLATFSGNQAAVFQDGVFKEASK